jgi:hypothetical protein
MNTVQNLINNAPGLEQGGKSGKHILHRTHAAGQAAAQPLAITVKTLLRSTNTPIQPKCPVLHAKQDKLYSIRFGDGTIASATYTARAESAGRRRALSRAPVRRRRRPAAVGRRPAP